MKSWPSPAAWVREVEGSISGPWPGPRPLNVNDGEVSLVGRTEELADFQERVRYRQLLHLRGESGVGKSSFLMAGVIPRLMQMGVPVFYVRDWSNPDKTKFDIWLMRQLRSQVPESDLPAYNKTRSDNGFLAEASRRNAILVLDQFEELIRASLSQRAAIFALVANLIRHTSLRVVLSYRSDSLHLMKPLLALVDSARTMDYELGPVKAEAGRELVESAAAKGFPDAITPDATEKVMALWEGSFGSQTGNATVGLLHLQALLFVLFDTAREAEGQIEAADVDDLTSLIRDQWGGEATTAGAEMTQADLFDGALGQAAARRLAWAAGQAGQLPGWTSVLVRESQRMCALILPLLSSGGFKVSLELPDLARQLLELEVQRALDSLPGGLRQRVRAPDLVAVLTRALAGADGHLDAPREEIAASIAQSVGLSPTEAELWVAARDKTDIAAGPLLGVSPLMVLIERARAFRWAALWLRSLSLAQVTEAADKTTITLVHDGLGEPMRRWSGQWFEDNVTWSLNGVSSTPGVDHVWGFGGTNRMKDEHDLLTGKPDRPRTLVNLVFKGNAILGANFTNVIFANCDFRGAFLLECSFKNVTFLNCRMDGSMFSDCTVGGGGGIPKSSGEGPKDLRAERSYLLPHMAPQFAASIRQYRGYPASSVPVCQPAGQPVAMVVNPEGVAPFEQSSPGLTLLGSRFSAMTIRGTRFIDDAHFVLQRAIGSGLDFVELRPKQEGDKELTPVRIDVVDSAVRHLTITPYADRDRGAGEQTQLEITVNNSSVAQWWIGQDFSGAMSIQNSQVGQLWNGSGGVGVAADASLKGVVVESAAVGLVGIRVDSGRRLPVADGTDRLDPASDADLHTFTEGAEGMDYRR